MVKVIETFSVVDDSGNEYEVEIWQNFIESRTRAGISRVRGMKRVQTSSGFSVNHIDDETFEIVQTGQILRKI